MKSGSAPSSPAWARTQVTAAFRSSRWFGKGRLRAEAVVDGDHHPALLGEMPGQGLGLTLLAPVHPRATVDVDERRSRTAGVPVTVDVEGVEPPVGPIGQVTGDLDVGHRVVEGSQQQPARYVMAQWPGQRRGDGVPVVGPEGVDQGLLDDGLGLAGPVVGQQEADGAESHEDETDLADRRIEGAGAHRDWPRPRPATQGGTGRARPSTSRPGTRPWRTAAGPGRWPGRRGSRTAPRSGRTPPDSPRPHRPKPASRQATVTGRGGQWRRGDGARRRRPTPG